MAYAMVGLADTGLGLLGDLQTIVNVDVNFPLFLGYFGVGVTGKGLMPASMDYFLTCLDTAAASLPELVPTGRGCHLCTAVFGAISARLSLGPSLHGCLWSHLCMVVLRAISARLSLGPGQVAGDTTTHEQSLNWWPSQEKCYHMGHVCFGHQQSLSTGRCCLGLS